MPAAGHDFTIIDFRICRSFDMQDSNQSALEPRKGVIDQNVVTRDFEFEFGDNGPAWRHRDRLDAFQRLAEIPV